MTTKRKSTISNIGTNLKHHEVVPLMKFLVLILILPPTLRRPLLELASRIGRLMRLSGYRAAARYLKVATVYFYKHLAGESVMAFRPGDSSPVAVAKDGLPLIIPGVLRSKIRKRDIKAIKLSLTLLSLYRTIQFPGQVKFGSILDGGPRPLIGAELRNLTGKFFSPDQLRWSGFRWSLLLTSGPNHKRSVYGAGLDAIGWIIRPHLLKDLLIILPQPVRLYLCVLGLLALPALIWKTYWSMVDRVSVVLLRRLDMWLRLFGWSIYLGGRKSSATPDSVWFPGFGPWRVWLRRSIPILGRLSVRHEPMGKERVFAIPDWWTQMALKPLHENVFRLLRKIPQDGTHDQLAPLHRLLDQARLSTERLYSLDLSSATDRFPVELQEEVLAFFVGNRKARAWKRVLVNRYWVYRTKGDDQDHHLKYGIGQPMGAYSSWAMFALTHHLVVQLAAARTGWKGWYPWYALLGDDIVILGDNVAKAYLAIMAQLGVEISAAKSLTSEVGVAEFAKHVLSPYRDYSTIGPKALLAAFREGLYMPALMTDLVNKRYPILSQDVMVGLEKSVSVRRSKLSKANHLRASLAILGPSGAFPLPIGDWISKRINPAGHRGLLSPPDSLSLAYALSALGQRERDSHTELVTKTIKSWWPYWYRVATGLPSWYSPILPHFWIKSLEMIELEMLERVPFSTKELRAKVRDLELITLDDVRKYYTGPDLARPNSLSETAGNPSDNWIRLSRLMCRKADRLFRTYKEFTANMENQDTYYTTAVVPYVEPCRSLMLVQQTGAIGCHTYNIKQTPR